MSEIKMAWPSREDRLMGIPLDELFAHPLNANRMSEERLSKLAQNIAQERQCPPLIVRPHPARPGAYQILDGHQRYTILKRLGAARAPCFVWPCDDKTALVLLSSLNRLQGEDVPERRADLLRELSAHVSVEELSRLLPEDAAQIDSMLTTFALDSRGLLEEFTRAARNAEQSPSRPMSFVLSTDDGAVLEAAVRRASSGLTGRNRRGRALGIIAQAYLVGAKR
jgi:ParB/RepB/Spo0J family partition protein